MEIESTCVCVGVWVIAKLTFVWLSPSRQASPVYAHCSILVRMHWRPAREFNWNIISNVAVAYSRTTSSARILIDIVVNYPYN